MPFPDAVGAGPSNAGDRYHFVYAARRMLAMLPPRSTVARIELEGVASEDLAAGSAPGDRFVGVDLTEYEGGDDGATASRIVLTQVKYSPLHPERPWTLGRLAQGRSDTRRRRPAVGRSVVAKLAQAYTALRAELTTSQAVGDPVELVVQLHTNQHLDRQLQSQLLRIQRAVILASPKDRPAILSQLSRSDADTFRLLRKAAALDTQEFAEFLARWNLAAFGQPMLAHEQGALWSALQMYSSDVHVDSLLGFIQEHAIPMRSHSIRRGDVLGQLRVVESDFWPAPALFEDNESLIETGDLRNLCAAIPPPTSPLVADELTRPVLTSDSATPSASRRVADIILLHGTSGSGKTSTLRLLARTKRHRPAAVVYDCFANAKGLDPTSARFPLQQCFPQITNELDALLGTAVLSTSRLDVKHLVERFSQAVRVAARAAALLGARLVLAFDAADNAQQAAKTSTVRLGDSFVPLLWVIEWPRNCTVIVSARTENIGALGLPIPPPMAFPAAARPLELIGFSKGETAKVARREGETDPRLVEALYNRTRGNPRVVRRVLEAIGPRQSAGSTRSLADRLAEVNRIARHNAFEYYRAETPGRMDQPQERPILAILAEATQSITVAQLGRLADRPESTVRATVSRLAFGLRLNADDRILFRDQDFWDFVQEALASERTQARDTLASYVQEHYLAGDEYSRTNFSRHLYAANRLDALVDWWTHEDRLSRDIDATAPYLERAFSNVQYALLAAAQLGRDADVLVLLSLGGDIVHGRDLFLEHLFLRPDFAVSLGALDEVLSVLSRQEATSELVGRYAALAAAAALNPRYSERVAELLNLIDATRREVYRKNERDSLERQTPRSGHQGQGRKAHTQTERADLWRGVFGQEDIQDHVRAFARAGRADDALRWLARLKPRDTLGDAFGTLAYEVLATPGAKPGALFGRLARAFRRLRPGRGVETSWAVGALGAELNQLDPASRQALVDIVMAAANDRAFQVDPAGVRRATEALARAGELAAARTLLAVCTPPPPTYVRDPSIPGFLNAMALREALGIAPFDPQTFDLPPAPNERSDPSRSATLDQSASDYETKRRAEEQRRVVAALRDRFAGRYPAELLRARALAARPRPDTRAVLSGANAILEGWRARGQNRGADFERDFRFDYPHVMCALLEALSRIPVRDEGLVTSILDSSDEILAPGSGRSLERAAQLLAREPRYHREAEHAISLLRRDARPPIARPADAVDMLLDAREAALLFDLDLASILAREARDVANSVEAEIPGRAAGLTALVARATAPGRQSSPAEPVRTALDARRVVRLAAYLSSVADDRREVDVAEALRYLARADPEAAGLEAIQLDADETLGIEEAATAMALGTIDAGQSPIDVVWPLARLSGSDAGGIFRTACETAVSRRESVDAPLVAYASEICRAARHTGGLQRFLDWADPLFGAHPAVTVVRAMSDRLKALPSSTSAPRGLTGDPPATRQGGQTWRSPGDEAEERLAAVRSALSDSPPAALDALGALPDRVLRLAPTKVLASLVADLADALPTGRLGEIAAQVERSAWEYGAEVFVALSEVAHRARTTATRAAVVATYRRLLTPRTIAAIVSGHFSDGTKAALGFELLEARPRLREIATAVGNRLSEFDAAVLYRLTGRLAELITPAEAGEVLAPLVRRAWDRIPTTVREEAERNLGRGRSTSTGTDGGAPSSRAIVALLADLHGHPAQKIRWRAVEATLDLLLVLPETSVGLVVAETFDSAHPRWLTKREWLLFGLECLARRAPDLLAAEAARIAEHALSPDLPHAKIRHHAREIVMAIHASPTARQVPGASLLRPKRLARIAAVNCPSSTVPARRAERQGIHRHRARRDPALSWPKYRFDSMDTLPYWYDPLGRVFGISAHDVADVAYPWITERWGITTAVVEAAWKEERERVRWEDRSHRQGSEPAIETIERYADRHGLLVAAGALLESRAVLDDGPREGDRWTDWARGDLHNPDPAFSSRLLVAPPPDAPDHYGPPAEAYEDWRRRDSIAGFLAELEGMPLPHFGRSGKADEDLARKEGVTQEWIVLSSSRSGTVGDRHFTAWVDPALISRGTAEAFQRLVHDAPNGVRLPTLRLGYDTILPQLEHDLRTRTDYYVSENDWIESHDGRFRLRALVGHLSQEKHFHQGDPWWPRLTRTFHVPLLELINEHRLTREPTELDWRTPDGQLAIRCEVWSDGDGRSDYGSSFEGVRLLARRRLLLDFAQRRSADILLRVTLQRSRPYGRGFPEEPYDVGESVAFLIGADGVPRATPRGTRAPDTRRAEGRKSGRPNGE